MGFRNIYKLRYFVKLNVAARKQFTKHITPILYQKVCVVKFNVFSYDIEVTLNLKKFQFSTKSVEENKSLYHNL